MKFANDFRAFIEVPSGSVASAFAAAYAILLALLAAPEERERGDPALSLYYLVALTFSGAVSLVYALPFQLQLHTLWLRCQF